MAPVVPIRQPDQQATQPMRRVDASPDAFGAAIGRAMVSAGGNIQDLGSALKVEEDKQAATNVTDAYTEASKKLRDAQFDPEKGLLNRQGKDAAGITQATEQTSQTIFAEISGNLKTDQEREAFKRMWARKQESAVDGSAEYEFRQRKALQQETKTSALSNLQDDVVANYKNPKALQANIDAARAIIRQNPDGLSDEGLEKLERQGISSLHASVIQRLVADSPGEALDYYEAHKGEVEGSDHATITSWIKGVSNVRTAKTATDEITNSGPAISIYKAVEGAESNGNPDAEGFRANADGKRAQGVMQLMPDTAREAAVAMGLSDVAAKTDKELGEFFSTKEGAAVNRKIGSYYLNKQLKTFDGDLEAALIAYNAGPENARKFLNGDRDYKTLPRGSETYAYVKKVMGSYLGVDLNAANEDEGSKAIQDAVNPKQPGARFQGDSKAFLMEKLQKGHPDTYINDLQPIMADSLAAMMKSAPDSVKAGLDILSGARSADKQAVIISRNIEKYGLSRKDWDADVVTLGPVEAGKKWAKDFKEAGLSRMIAKPGGSRHQHGDAVDLGWNGGKFANAPDDVKKWVHDNASRFGLKFPMGHEPWHIETEGARDPKAKTSRFATVSQDRMDQAFTDNPPDVRVQSDGQVPSPAAIYSNTFKPYTVGQDKSDLNDWLAAANERYGDNPPLLAEVTRQLTQKYETQVAEQKQQVDQLQQGLYAKVLNGEKVADMDRNALLAVGEDNVGKLMKIEEKFAKADNPDETDEATYIELSRMSPEDLRAANLMDYADRLSRADLKSWADKQAAVSRPASRDQMSAGMRTRTQIVSSAVDTLGLNPKPGTDDAKTVALLDRSVDERIAAFTAEKGVPPDPIEVQKIVDQLVMEGTVRKDWAIDDTKKVFELTPEEQGQFYPGDEKLYVDSYGDIPPERTQAVRNVFTKVYPSMADKANEEGEVQIYNDMVRIEQGAAPAPPDDLAPQIKQLFSKKYGRAPTLEEQAAVYRRLILKATGQ